MVKTYGDLIKINSFVDRYRYLRIGNRVGDITFGCDRWLNQVLYKSKEWIDFRDEIIIRDAGCDMAFQDVTITGLILVHHINPITKKDILNRNECIFDPNNVVCVSKAVHDAIHFGDESLLPMVAPIVRTMYDTCPWKNK